MSVVERLYPLPATADGFPSNPAERLQARAVRAVVPVQPGVGADLLLQESGIEQVSGQHVAHRGEQRGPHAGMLALQLREETFHPLALQVLLRAAQIARNDGERSALRKRGDVRFRA